MTEDVSHWYYPREWPLARAAEELPDAGLDDLPAVLARPPWRPRRRPPRTILDRTVPKRSLTLHWQPGERQQWAETPLGRYPEEHWRNRAATFLGNPADTWMSYGLINVLAVVPDELALPHLQAFRPCRFGYEVAPFRRLLGRFEAQALDFVFSAVQHNPRLAEVLAPIDGTAVSIFWARWLNSGTRRTANAMRWFDRHISTATTDLIAIALTRSGKDRIPAEHTLRVLAAAGHGDAIQAAAAAYHRKAPTAVDTILHSDPLLLLPKRIPRPRQWITLDRLPKVLLRRRHAVLPVSAMADLVTMLMMCRPGNDYAGVRAVIEATEPTTLARFARELLDQWARAGYPAKDDWVLHAQGLLGDYSTVSSLRRLVARWSRMADAGRAATTALHNGRLAEVGYAFYGEA
ncbi:hypothetical protein ACWEPH_31345 [Nocardia beijingensis]|uniref:hypothetical protein n=1 Tax=Nocardia beijingensis TaxID=95162 RepID=UPI00340158A5